MSVKKILNEIDLLLPKEEQKELSEKASEIVQLIKNEIKKKGIDADVFVGGSFAKGTLIRGNFYDIDMFIRFGWKHENLSNILDGILKNISKKNKLRLEKVHGSRDYFRIISGKKIIFEVVPVTRIKKPREARNVTDLSYFHVNYVKKRAGKLRKEIVHAKQFCKAAGVYGAESYIHGFSGYALECLIIHYKSLEKMLRELGKAKEGERIIVDPEGLYKKRTDVLFEMNESRLQSPVILVDPTWKERNALAALSRESFKRFQEAARAFLKRPSKSFFEIKKFDIKDFKKKTKKGEEFVQISLKTGKQPGDIAGTKLKKFTNYMENELSRFFGIKEKEFDYSGENEAKVYLIVKPKKEIIKIGPPIKLEKHASAFKKQNRNAYEKNGNLYAKIRVTFTAKKFIQNFAKKYDKTIKGMGIVSLGV